MKDSFQVTREADGTLALSGIIDETAELGFLEQLSGPTRLDMRKVRRINSFGVRAWIEAIRRVPQRASVELVACPPAVVDQLNMVAGFLPRGRVTSFFAPMICPRCATEDEHLFQVAEYRAAGKLPPIACPKCGAAMEVDDLEEHYLLFARDG